MRKYHAFICNSTCLHKDYSFFYKIYILCTEFVKKLNLAI